MGEGRVVHLMVDGERRKDGPERTYGPYAGEPDWQDGSACGQRVSTFAATRVIDRVSCNECRIAAGEVS